MSAKPLSRISDEDRKTFAAIADLLIPAYGKMPAATEVGVHGEMLDRVLGFRPDIVEAFQRGLEKCRGKSASDGANALSQDDQAAFEAISLVASAGYYMSDRVRALIGYPGQENAPYDLHETPTYLTNGMIERVARRGPIYKPTPR
jgi:hypothetical protein